MSNLVIFVNYEVLPERREQYLNTMKDLKNEIQTHTNLDYQIFESKNKKNYFTEIFKCESRESFSEYSKISVTSERFLFLLSEVDKCTKKYSNIGQEQISFAA